VRLADSPQGLHLVRKRADVLLVSRGLAKSRDKARELIRGGRVTVGNTLLSKPAALLDDDAPLRISVARDFVSRGGDKLDAALDQLSVDLRHAVVVDVGASTGGFTDCALQTGAKRVYAVDVGHGQLDRSLRDDARVVVREKTNARHLTAESFPEPIDVVLVDASFISLEKLASALAAILPAGGRLIALVKPQFEVGRAVARRGRGVVRDGTVRARAIASARDALTRAGFDLEGECDSALHGPKGNVEHFVVAVRRGS
jgi:23S rRNA (cytidine1920-2'-O)/16S rRNA (cytidine1409-2'-O)-methyltransferase